jgi:hypothetical protein
MTARALAVTAITAVLLGAMYIVFRTTGHAPAPPQSRTYRLRLDDHGLTSGPAVLEAVLGDSITIVVTSNRAGTLHVHEYEQHIVIDLEPGRESSGRFTADRAGRFGVHLIGADGAHAQVAAVEVQPR